MIDIKVILKLLHEEGALVRQTKKNHWKVINPINNRSVVLGGTPSDHRALRNMRSRLRSIGLLTKENRAKVNKGK